MHSRRSGALASILMLLALSGGGEPAHGSGPAAGAFRVIVHADNPTRSLERAEVARLFLKRVTRWSDDVMVQPADQKPGSAVRAPFSEAVLGRSVTAVRSYWQQAIFSGRGVPPPELDSDEAVLRYVRGHRGAIGYVSAGSGLAGTHELRVE